MCYSIAVVPNGKKDWMEATAVGIIAWRTLDDLTIVVRYTGLVVCFLARHYME